MPGIRLVIDTNVVGLDPPLSGNAMRRLLDSSRRGTLCLVVCDLVRAEAASGWARRVEEQLRKERTIHDALRRLGIDRSEQRSPAFAELREQQRARIDAKLSEARALNAPLPAIPHTEVVRRALERRVPFDSDGKDGYRDSLLWETIVELAQSEPVVFVSRDVRAYFDGGKDNGLHRALDAEVRDRCALDAAVALFFDLDDAVDYAIERTAAEQARNEQAHADREAKRALGRCLRDPPYRAELIERMRTSIIGWGDLSWAEIQPLVPHPSTYDVLLEDIEDVADIQIVDSRRLSDEIIATLSARLLVSVEVHLPASDAATIDEDDALVFGDEEQGSILKASALRTVRGHFEASFDPNDLSVRRMRLRRFTRSRR